MPATILSFAEAQARKEVVAMLRRVPPAKELEVLVRVWLAMNEPPADPPPAPLIDRLAV